jgi:hypothetical protein
MHMFRASWRRRHPRPTAVPAPTPTGSATRREPGDGPLWRIRTTVTDVPGRLAALCAALGDSDVNIVAIHVRVNARGPAGTVVDDLVVLAPPDLPPERIALAVGAGGGTGAEVWPYDGKDPLDVPTPSWAAGPSPEDLSRPGRLAAARRTRL